MREVIKIRIKVHKGILGVFVPDRYVRTYFGASTALVEKSACFEIITAVSVCGVCVCV